SVDNSLTKGIQNFLQKLRGKKIEETPKFSSKEQVERALPKIEPKIEHVEKQLRRIGIDSRRLENKGLLKLFYSIYNADAET
ncbi:MAG: hypothetical protein ACOC4Z_02160, partial [Patescibacteria group bacterium]